MPKIMERQANQVRSFSGWPNQKRARWFGVLFLITYVTSIPALLLYEPVLRDPVGYIAGGGP